MLKIMNDPLVHSWPFCVCVGGWGVEDFVLDPTGLCQVVGEIIWHRSISRKWNPKIRRFLQTGQNGGRFNECSFFIFRSPSEHYSCENLF